MHTISRLFPVAPAMPSIVIEGDAVMAQQAIAMVVAVVIACVALTAILDGKRSMAGRDIGGIRRVWYCK